jgi:quinol monooxygenase YgiN
VDIDWFGDGPFRTAVHCAGVTYDWTSMAKYALFLQHRTKPGKREEVQRVWQKHMQPAIEANGAHNLYVYSFGDSPDRICAFQVYDSDESAAAFLKSPEYRAYQHEVEMLLDGPPQVEVLRPQWIKGIS